jgi:serine/threonine-protein kinase
VSSEGTAKERVYKVGDRIGGDFLVKDVFGGTQASGMGVVYLVEHRGAVEPFVLKTYQDKDSAANLRGEFQKEAEAWVSVGIHPNIVRALWVDEFDFRLFVAAEYIPKDESGRNSVQDFLCGLPLHPHWVIKWTAQFCYGMRYAMGKGLACHRDIKPANLMVDRELNLRISDFGLAVLNSQPNDLKGHPVGTVPYLAPEQVTNPGGVDHRADIYAFGIVMYGLLTGGGYPYRVRRDGDVASEFI